MRRLFAVVAVVLVALPVPPAGAIDDVDVADLLADPVAYADARIALVGEFVGDYGFRPDGTVWTQLNDDPYATAPLHAAAGTPSGANVGVGVVGDDSMFSDLDSTVSVRWCGPSACGATTTTRVAERPTSRSPTSNRSGPDIPFSSLSTGRCSASASA